MTLFCSVLIGRNDPATIPLLEKLAGIHAHPLAQIHALWTLEGMGKLTAAPILAALPATDTKVTASALWASTRLTGPELAKLEPALLALQPANHEVAIYLARALGPLGTPKALDHLADLVAKHGNKPFLKAAAFSGLDHHELDFKTAAADRINNLRTRGSADDVCATKGVYRVPLDAPELGFTLPPLKPTCHLFCYCFKGIENEKLNYT